MNRISYVKLEDAEKIVAHWGGRVNSVKHLGNSGNSVFEFLNELGKLQILRFTDSSFRTPLQVEGELEFINHLHQSECLISIPLRNRHQQFLMACEIDGRHFSVTSFTYATGQVVRKDAKEWGPTFFSKWGECLGKIHQASQSFVVEREKLWQWKNEILFLRLDDLLPPEDGLSKHIIQETIKECITSEKKPANFGVIHGDFGAQNFHCQEDTTELTAFDFGNSCYHYYLADVANLLTTVRGDNDYVAIKESILEGYTKYTALPADYENQIALFTRLRYQYVYLDRLYTMGTSDDPLSRALLGRLRQRVHQKEDDSF